MSPNRQAARASSPATAASRPHIAEWFGHRVFPTVSSEALAMGDQRAGRCPFLTETLKAKTPCVKAPNSLGVCTISASQQRTTAGLAGLPLSGTRRRVAR